MRLSIIVVLALALSGCSDDDGKKDSGDGCEKDADCESGLCITETDGTKTCDASGPTGGGW